MCILDTVLVNAVCFYWSDYPVALMGLGTVTRARKRVIVYTFYYIIQELFYSVLSPTRVPDVDAVVPHM